MFKRVTLIATIFLLFVGTSVAEDLEATLRELSASVAVNFFDPGPALVAEALEDINYYGYPDLGMNLTAATTHQTNRLLFGEDFWREDDTVKSAQHIILRDIRFFLANPNNLTGLWYQVRMFAVPTLLNNVGVTRARTWLSPAASLFEDVGFDPALGSSYEDWRTNGCQWYLQISPSQSYIPNMTENDCATHAFVVELAGENATADNVFVNKAHWYGFLWRRYLEGDIGLVIAWQNILSEITSATQAG